MEFKKLWKFRLTNKSMYSNRVKNWVYLLVTSVKYIKKSKVIIYIAFLKADPRVIICKNVLTFKQIYDSLLPENS